MDDLEEIWVSALFSDLSKGAIFKFKDIEYVKSGKNTALRGGIKGSIKFKNNDIVFKREVRFPKLEKDEYKEIYGIE